MPGSDILDRELLVAELCKLCGMVLLLIIFFAKVDINYASSAVMFSLAARLHDFSVTIPDVTRMSLSTVSFFTQLDSGILCP